MSTLTLDRAERCALARHTEACRQIRSAKFTWYVASLRDAGVDYEHALKMANRREKTLIAAELAKWIDNVRELRIKYAK